MPACGAIFWCRVPSCSTLPDQPGRPKRGPGLHDRRQGRYGGPLLWNCPRSPRWSWGLPGLAGSQVASLGLREDAGSGWSLSPGNEVEWLFYTLVLLSTGQPHPGGDKWVCCNTAPPALRTKDAGPGCQTLEDATATDWALVGRLPQSPPRVEAARPSVSSLEPQCVQGVGLGSSAKLARASSKSCAL